MLGWIYAVRDRGFDIGVKVGRDSNHPSRFKKAQCYSPRGIDLVATWRIENGFPGLSAAETRARVGLPPVAGENCGAEWCALTPKEAIECISNNLGVQPVPFSGNPKITTTYDDFRDPKKLLGTERHRQILWIYRENKTDRIKVQRTASWKVPLEPIKTYSILGFKPIACFSLFGDTELRMVNDKVHSVWTKLVNEFGNGPGDSRVGWLRSEICFDRVRSSIQASGLTEITNWGRCPPDVRPGY